MTIWFKNKKTGVMWEVDESNENLISRLDSEEEDKEKVYERTQDPTAKKAKAASN